VEDKPNGKHKPKALYLFFINGAKERAPAAAGALLERLGWTPTGDVPVKVAVSRAAKADADTGAPAAKAPVKTAPAKNAATKKAATKNAATKNAATKKVATKKPVPRKAASRAAA